MLEPVERVLQAIVDKTAAVIYVRAADGRYLLINQRFEDLFHVGRSEIIGKTDYDIFAKEQADVFRANDERVLAEGRPIEIDERVSQDDGLHQYISLKFPLPGDAGSADAVCGISTDVTSREEAQIQLRRSLSLLEATIESTADGILVVDRVGSIVRYNRRFVELWRIPDTVLASRNDDAAIDFVLDQLVDPEAFLAKVRSLYVTPDTSSYDTLSFKDGRTFERYSQPQRLGDDIVGRVWSFRDVTARVRAEQHRDQLLAEERKARVRAEEAVQVRDEFLSIASHELRTPVASLMLVIQALEQRLDSLDTDKVRWAVANASRQVDRLGRLIDSLLDVSRIQAGQLELKRDFVDLAAIARDVVDQLADEAVRRNTQVTLITEGPAVGRWDGFRLEQAATNLLTNALKFGLGRPVEVRVATADGVARLTVRDQGIGIPQALRPGLFQRFSRAVSARSYGGLGLGLYITRLVVEAHHGTIGVTSEEGQGSTFIVELPTDVADEEAT